VVIDSGVLNDTAGTGKGLINNSKAINAPTSRLGHLYLIQALS